MTAFATEMTAFAKKRIQHQLFPHRSKTLPPLFLTFGFSDIDVKKSFVFPRNFRKHFWKAFPTTFFFIIPSRKAEKPAVFTKKRAVILILSADTIRLSADILIAFENFLIVFWNISRKVENFPIS